MKTIPITQFNGGMTSDAYNTSSFSQLCKHFDNFTSKHRLDPYKSSSAVTVSPAQTASKIEKMLMYNSIMYGLGQTASGYVQIFSSSNISVPSFAIATSGAGAAQAVDYGIFIEYKGILYGGTGLRYIWSYNIGTPALNETLFDVTSYTNLGGGLVHSKDDVLYLAIDNKIYYKNGAGGIALGLTLPTNLIITSICEYGNYLAIACRPLYQDSANSKVFLWDRDVTLTTVSETIDWGNNNLFTIENIDGFLIGVATKGMASITGGTNRNLKLVLSKYAGGGAIVFSEVPLGSYYSAAIPYLIRDKQKFNNRLYFGLSATSTAQVTGDFTGIWSVGRSGENTPFAVQFDRTPNDDTATLRVNGFLYVNDYCYISYQTNAVAWAFSFTIYPETFNTTSIYRTVVNPGMADGDKIEFKKLMSANLTYEPVIAGMQCVLKYRVDGGSWTTIFTETTTGAKSTKRVASSSVSFTDGEDYEFEIQSKGVVVTGLFYGYEVIQT